MTVLEQLLGSVGRGGLLPQDDTGSYRGSISEVKVYG